MVIDFGREICGDLASAERREWLCTNGIGGFASGTLAGTLTRRYHGLLVAALTPPLGRTLLATKVDETIECEGLALPLSANRWAGDAIEPHGYSAIERFTLDGTTPVWIYAVADACVEKRVWMEQGANTTYVRYRVLRARGRLALTAKLLVNYRDYHGATRAGDWRMDIAQTEHGLRVSAFDGASPLVALADRADVRIAHTWYRDFELAGERARGLDATEDHLHAGTFSASLAAGETMTLVLSAESAPALDGEQAWKRQAGHEARLVATWRLSQPAALQAPDWVERLVLASDQFIAKRAVPDDADGMTIIAGYHWFGDWGRDTMIALPGLTLATGRPEIARRILRTFARFVDRGMLPNRFPDAGEAPEYNTVDATLWYFEAIRAYHAATNDDALLEELFSVLEEIVRWHREGTRYGIKEDPADGLLRSGEPGVQLTWMDARVGDWVVTPRTGKAVEINALWYNALCSMAVFAKRLGKPSRPWNELAARVRAGFGRFWNERLGCCYDVIDSPEGNDDALRPNQIFAVSLRESPLSAERQSQVVDACARHLLTSCGLRSLAPEDSRYQAHYGGDQKQRDGAYHQGPVWAFLLGPFALAHFKVYGDSEMAGSFLSPLAHHLGDYGLGSIAEIFDGDAPFRPRGCIAQAWSVAETLRAWHELAVHRRVEGVDRRRMVGQEPADHEYASVASRGR
jgi:predicted glycogen debranching enzyme